MSDRIQSIINDCKEIIALGGDRITLVLNKGCSSRGLGFGRGELMCEQHDGSRAFSFKASKVLDSLTEGRPA